MNSNTIIKISFGKIKILLETNSESKMKEILKEFANYSDKQKYLCISEPYSSMLKIADLVTFVNEEINDEENFNFKLQGMPYEAFYVLKRATWKKFKSGIKVSFPNPSAQKTRNPLESYMNHFVLKMVDSTNSAMSDDKDQLVADLKYFFQMDASEAFKVQHELFELKRDSTKVQRVSKPNSFSVSVIVPTKNVTVEDISRSIDSYIGQLSHSDEIIVIDDNDYPQTEIRNLCQKYISTKYVIGEKRGVAAARNLGLRISCKELVAFIDSDDYVDVDFISLQRDFHANNLQVAATGTWLKAFGSLKVVYPQWDNLRLFSLTHCLPPAGVLMWKRNVLVKELNGFDDSFGIGFEDFDLVARASIAEKSIVVLEEVKYFYQRGQQSLTQSWSPLDESILSQKVRLHAREFNDVEFAYFLEIYERFGSGMERIPFDIFVKNVSWMRPERLFWYLLNRVRTNRNVRKNWLRTPKTIRTIANRLIWLLASFIDFLHQTRLGKILDPLYDFVKK